MIPSYIKWIYYLEFFLFDNVDDQRGNFFTRERHEKTSYFDFIYSTDDD